MSSQLLIIEYCNECIKTIVVETANKQAHILSRSVYEFESDDFERAVDALALDHAPKQFSKVIVSVSRKKFLSNFFVFPSQIESEIEKMMELQILKLEKETDSKSLKRYNFSPLYDGHSWVHLLSLQSRVIDPFISYLAHKEFSVVKVILSSSAIVAWAKEKFVDDNCGQALFTLVDIDKTNAECVVFNTESLLFSRVFEHNGDTHKLSAGLKQSLGNFEMNYGKCKYQTIFFSGVKKSIDLSGLDCDDMQNYCDSENSEETEVYSFNSLYGAQRIDDPMIMDFTPLRIAHEKSTKIRRFHMLEMAKIIFKIIIVIGIVLFSRTYMSQYKHDQISSAISEINDDIYELESMSRRLSHYGMIRADHAFLSDIFYEIFDKSSNAMTFISVDIKKDKTFYIKGYAVNMADVFNYEKKLSLKVDVFETVKTDYVRKQKGASSNKHEFYIMGKIK